MSNMKVKVSTQYERQNAASKFVESAMTETTKKEDESDDDDDNEQITYKISNNQKQQNHSIDTNSNIQDENDKYSTGNAQLEKQQIKKNSNSNNKKSSTKGTIAMRQSLYKLRQTIVCTICNNVYLDPVTIQCGHTFCSMCIDQHSENNWNCPIKTCGMPILMKGGRPGSKYRKPNPAMQTIVTSWTTICQTMLNSNDYWWQDFENDNLYNEQDEQVQLQNKNQNVNDDEDDDDDDDYSTNSLSDCKKKVRIMTHDNNNDTVELLDLQPQQQQEEGEGEEQQAQNEHNCIDVDDDEYDTNNDRTGRYSC